ncbi:MAG: hydrogenase small subunit [Phycisphaerae bacterium]
MPDTVEIPLVWLQGSACSGCVVSLLNSFAPGAASVVLRELTPGKHVSVRFLMTAMAGQGQQVVDILTDETIAKKGGHVLVLEGSVPVGHEVFCTLGESDGREVPLSERFADLARSALAVVAVGTCSSFGGIPSGAPNPTGAISAGELLKREGIGVPLVNIPGCPPHPDWIVGSLMAVAMYGLDAVAAQLDELSRPKMYYGKLIHETCPRRADFDANRFARKFGDPGCLYELGCKGPVTYADCPTRMWNSGTNWCVGAGSPCHGCVEPGFPDDLAPLYKKIDTDRLDGFKLLAAPASSGRDD